MKDSTSVLFFMSSLKRVPMKDSTSVLFFMSSLKRGTKIKRQHNGVAVLFWRKGESNAALRKQPTDWLFLAAGVIA